MIIVQEIIIFNKIYHMVKEMGQWRLEEGEGRHKVRISFN